jgi:hypothetical protein
VDLRVPHWRKFAQFAFGKEISVTSGLSAEELCHLSLACTATVLDLKEEISRIVGIPVKEQRLVLGTKFMKNGNYLEDFIQSSSTNLLDVSLVRSDPEDDPQVRQKRFRTRYLHGGFGPLEGRWDYHRARASMETDLNTGWSRGGRLYVKMQQDESHSATFNLCSLDFPLSELFDTFAEQIGVPIAELRFSYQGRHLGCEDTPHLCGMEPCSCEAAHVISIERADGQRRRMQLFAILNNMGDAVKLKPCAQSSVQIFPLGADVLLKILLFMPLPDLLNTTVVSAFWFHATQRLSLMLQLRHGDLAIMTAPPQEYTAWLTSVFGHSQQLAVAEAQSRHKEVEVWQALNVSKEKVTQAYSFTKAAGCTTMKTISLDSLSAEFEQQWLSLHSSKAKFMAECKEWCKCQPTGTARVGHVAEGDSFQQKVQDLPPAGAQCFSTEAISPAFRAVAIQMFRKYFSPDMYFIFPLIVGKEAAFGLDFRSTTTTLFFGPHKSVPPAGAKLEAAPAGACAWRFRWPLLPNTTMPVATGLQQPSSLLEVLFIAVWEEERYQIHGGSLVGDLEAKAREAGVTMLYVEIGFEQPKARRFWRKQGFGKAVRTELTEIQRKELLEAEEQEDVPMPIVPLSDAQFDFFEINCLRFSDTAQYVKIL